MPAELIDDAKLNDREVKSLELVCSCSVKVVWLKLPSEWTDAEVNRQLDDAASWFRKYCINLQYEEFVLDLAAPNYAKRKKAWDALLDAYVKAVALISRGLADSEDELEAVQDVVEAIYARVARQVGKKIQVAFFLDEWFVLADTSRNRVSANHGSIMLLALDRYDRSSPLMLAHELAHGLRKPVGGAVPKDCILKFCRSNGIGNVSARSWEDHYGGKNQDRAMLFIDRTRAFQPYNKYTQNHVLSVREYLTVLRSGQLACAEGCTSESPARLETKRQGARVRQPRHLKRNVKSG